jgi:hypothetical protein
MKNFVMLLLLLPLSAFAQTVTLTPPTKRIDGSALPASQIANYEVTCTGWTPTGGTRGTCTQFATQNIAGSGAAITGTVPASGGTAFWVVRTRDTAGLLSAASAEVSKVFANTVPPNPPTNVVIAQAVGVPVSVVFKILLDGSRSTAVAGFIQVGKPCIGATAFTYRNQPYMQVEQSDVVKFRTVVLSVTDRVAAPCG